MGMQGGCQMGTGVCCNINIRIAANEQNKIPAWIGFSVRELEIPLGLVFGEIVFQQGKARP